MFDFRISDGDAEETSTQVERCFAKPSLFRSCETALFEDLASLRMNRLSCSLQHGVVSIAGAIPCRLSRRDVLRGALPCQLARCHPAAAPKSEMKTASASPELTFSTKPAEDMALGKTTRVCPRRCNAYAAELLAFGGALKVH